MNIADAMLGTLVSVYSIMVGVFAIIAGPISDKVGRRRILILGCGAMTVALSLHGLVTGYLSFIAVRSCLSQNRAFRSTAASVVSVSSNARPRHPRNHSIHGVMSSVPFCVRSRIS